MSSISRIGFIGLGIMGRPMAHRLLRAGYPLVVHSRSPGPVQELVDAGAARAETPAGVAELCDAIITMLPETSDVESVVSGVNGLMAAAAPGSLVIDMSTIDPPAARQLGILLGSRGIEFVDAPVSGGEKAAIDGSLSIMVGGEAAAVLRSMPILQVLGKTIVHVGVIGAGQIAKVANQLVVGLNIEAVAEAMTLAEASGVDPVKVREALLGGFAASRVLEVHGQRMIDRNFTPGFRIRLHLKDAKIVARTAAALGIQTPAFAVVLDRLARLAESGSAEADHSALFPVGNGNLPSSE